MSKIDRRRRQSRLQNSPTGFLSVTTFRYELSGITAFALVGLVRRREMVMPVGRYMAWVGTLLLALLFVADWCLPKNLPEPAHDAINRPVIRIASIQQLPEPIFIDTNQPTIVPPPAQVAEMVLAEPSPRQSYASAAPPATVIGADKKISKGNRPQASKVVAKQAPSAGTIAVASGSPATTLPPTRLSFADIISGQLVRDLFNLR